MTSKPFLKANCFSFKKRTKQRRSSSSSYGTERQLGHMKLNSKMSWYTNFRGKSTPSLGQMTNLTCCQTWVSCNITQATETFRMHRRTRINLLLCEIRVTLPTLEAASQSRPSRQKKAWIVCCQRLMKTKTTFREIQGVRTRVCHILFNYSNRLLLTKVTSSKWYKCQFT